MASLLESETLTLPENLVLYLPRSEGSEQADFALPETLTKNSHSDILFSICVSIPLILHSLRLYLHGQFNSLWNSRKCLRAARVHAKCLYIA